MRIMTTICAKTALYKPLLLQYDGIMSMGEIALILPWAVCPDEKIFAKNQEEIP